LRRPFEFVPPEVIIVKCRAGKTASRLRDDQGIDRSGRLNPRCQIQSLADCDPFLGTAFADQLTHDDQSGRDADPDFGFESGARVDRRNSVD
jgi:hypothetical protein